MKDWNHLNITTSPPTQPVAAVRATEEGRALVLLKWGLIPSWSKGAAIGQKFINARAETVAEKPSFRSAFKQRRCLIPASGFYEWRKDGKRNQPYFVRLRDEELFSFAGLWERWHDPEGEEIETCAIVTTTANEVMQPIHERMPVILDPSAEEQWLDSRSTPDSLSALLVPFASERMEVFPVNLYVNNARNEGQSALS